MEEPTPNELMNQIAGLYGQVRTMGNNDMEHDAFRAVEAVMAGQIIEIEQLQKILQALQQYLTVKQL